MQLLNRARPDRLAGNSIRALLALLLIAGCISCGPQTITGRPPFISISEMSLVDDRLAAEFNLSNQNEVEMSIQMIDITVTVNEVELTRENRDFDLVIDANSTEKVRVEELPDEFTSDLLASLSEGEVKSLPFDLNGRVNTLEDGVLRFEHRGHLYPVPGKPGYFRSAVTQAKGLTRENDF
mgnify:FL=1|jgi:LEA14-like dessication related protein